MATDVNRSAPWNTGGDGEGSDAQGHAADAAGRAQDAAQQATARAQEKARQASGQAQARLRDQLEQRSAQAAEQINQQASDLRSVSQSLRDEGKDGPADAADRLAGYAEKVGGYLRDNDSDALLADAEQFGRDRPWAAAAGGLALGLAASRFLKASSRQRYQARDTTASPRRREDAPVAFAEQLADGGLPPQPQSPGSPVL